MRQLHKKLGVYVHIPFCAKPCGYCRFYKKIPSEGDIDAFIGLVAREARYLKNTFEIPTPDTMFWGGGTPSIMSPSQISRLADILGGAGLLPSDEWTVEISPSTTTRQKLEALKAAGVSRVSLGVQSFSAETLAALGRAHTLAQTLSAIGLAQNAGFKHFSIDLIFGARGQTLRQFESDMLAAAATGAGHISAYCLEFESGTSACAGLKSGKEADENSLEAAMFKSAMRVLPSLGYAQYEISNYARSAKERCLHNLCTWHMAQWLGLGPSAASQFGGRRFRNAPSMKLWAEGIEKSSPALEDVVLLDDAEMFESALIFGLRMNGGVNLQSLKARFPKADAGKYAEPLERLRRQKLVKTSGARVALTARGRLYADAVAVELL